MPELCLVLGQSRGVTAVSAGVQDAENSDPFRSGQRGVTLEDPASESL